MFVEQRDVRRLSRFKRRYSQAKKLSRGHARHVDHVGQPALAQARQVSDAGVEEHARAGQISNFTGIHDAYEPPESPELRLDAAGHAPEVLAGQVLALLRERGKISQETNPSSR